MPELPEVQTIVDDLNQKIKSDTISDFWTDWPKAIKGKSLKEFQKEIKGRKILRARRIGKNIFFDLSDGKTLYIHLKMTGHLLVKDQKSKIQYQEYFDEKVNNYIHHVWHLGKDKTLEFSDLRKFGKIVLDDADKIEALPEVRQLGVDAMSPAFTFQKFAEILEEKKKQKIRDVLMDQNAVAGIGNIYMSEILFEAKILPTRLVGKINPKEQKDIFDSIKKVLGKAIKLRGTSDSDYRDTAGAPGSFQKVLRVYRRVGKKCRKCGTIIKRIKMGQRSAFYCPVCQK